MTMKKLALKGSLIQVSSHKMAIDIHGTKTLKTSMLLTTTQIGLTIHCQVRCTRKDPNDRILKDMNLRDPNISCVHRDQSMRTIALNDHKSTITRSDPIFRDITQIGLNLMTDLCDLSAKIISLRDLAFINGQCDPNVRATSLESISDQNALREKCMSEESIFDPNALKERCMNGESISDPNALREMHMSLRSIADQSPSNGSTRDLSLILDRCASLRNILILECCANLKDILI